MILVDGEPCDVIPVDDRGLAYGDGLFETLRVHGGRLMLLDYHIERLFAGLHVLGFPAVSREGLVRELETVAQDTFDGIVKLTVTRGSGRGYRPPLESRARRIIQGMPAAPGIASWRTHGLALRMCRTPLEGPRALDGLKHLNRLAQVLARAEWTDSETDEGLMRDTEGQIVEGTMSNLFVVLGGTLVTPPVGIGKGPGVCGVMRRYVLERARERGIPVEERFLADAELNTAGEIFVTNSIIGICPVRQIEKRSYAIGTLTRLLQADILNDLERPTCSED